ncbi:MAG TPA: hypothetical protein VIO84_04010 [Candidatus Dormibacteraeota bacterium]|jgi:hypothetical protein
MIPQPALVASQTSGVDGSSEGGRLSTMRLPYTLVLYAVPLIDELKHRGYKGKLTAEPALVDGSWVLKLIYDGDTPKDVPRLWHGHHVLVEKAPPPPPPPAPKSG